MVLYKDRLFWIHVFQDALPISEYVNWKGNLFEEQFWFGKVFTIPLSIGNHHLYMCHLYIIAGGGHKAGATKSRLSSSEQTIP